MTRFGIVTLMGEPNAGKSALLNALLEEKLAIVSGKPQSTREAVSGILTQGDTQLVLIDPPGLLNPRYALQEVMLEGALASMRAAHVIAHLVPLSAYPGPELTTYPKVVLGSAQKVLRVYTKADLASSAPRLPLSDDAIVVSSVSGEGLVDLVARLKALVPEGPFRHNPDDMAIQPLRFFAAEFVREAAFELLDQELPYSVHVEVDEFREAEDPVYIRAIIYVERESQKPVVLGAGGRQIRELGMAARPRIEGLLGRRVYLDLWVKVLPKWRRRRNLLRRLRLST